MIAQMCHVASVFVMVGIPPAPTDAAGRVEMELVTDRDFPVTGSHEWSRMLAGLGADRVRIRRLRAGEDFEPRIEQVGASGQPRHRLYGILTSDNTLQLPGGTFHIRETARLQRYLETLGTEGPEGVTTKEERFGLSLRQLAELTDALALPLDMATKGVPPAGILRAAEQRLPVRIVVDPDARLTLDDAEPAVDEVRGLALGTALASILGREGLILQPHKPRGAPVELAVARAESGRDAWPVGWPPEKQPQRVAPSLFESTTVEIQAETLAAALKAVEPRLLIPLLMDHQALARQQIEPAHIRVSFPVQRTFYKNVLDRILFQARLKGELRVDEAGKPFFWITTIQR